ncbi:MAG: hypothetical protein F4Y45_15020 [Acidobacteria bacterium]|nr:hypothetical protein [Acidobacteriota bacterium]MYJ02784.1 hypothetical protein [Acidobacteriota bacterium]
MTGGIAKFSVRLATLAPASMVVRPIVKGESGMSYTSGSDEFGTIRYEDPSRIYQVGDKLELIVSHCHFLPLDNRDARDGTRALAPTEHEENKV